MNRFVLASGMVFGCMGLMVGLSETHTAGLVITSILGAAVSLLPIALTRKVGELAVRKDLANRLAGCVIGSSLAMVGGLFMGMHIRQNGFALHPPTQLRSSPWLGSAPPSQGKEAMDWIVIQERLLPLGYSPEFVQELYRSLHRPPNEGSVSNVIEEAFYEPLSDLLPQAEKPSTQSRSTSAGRFIASESGSDSGKS